ncbi:outer membrane beta-barrel protein [Tellurirhabdus bombi]|uniref:outer membrane beta-barrel protein n=1 Tax=Tellurirhabdus bombi TaxID=2907205 RepID=UPI001F2200D2|nr:outer membrane beta-barrel protein [Tellurirhabdus bombi]
MKLLWIVLLLAVSSHLLAQTTNAVTGLVQDQQGKPLELATILLLKAVDSSLVKGAVSDAQGRYHFEAVAPGSYRVAVSSIGYQKAYSAIFAIETNATESHTLPPLIAKDESQQLAHVTVKGQKPFIEQQLDKTVLNVENSLVASGGSALEILEKAPGVVVDAQAERISLKGRENVLVMLDGKPTYLSPTEVLDLLRNTPSNNVETIELISNPSLRYDAAGTAGIINIRLKRNKSPQPLNGNVTAGLGYGRFPKYNAGLTLNARPGRWSLFGNYTLDQRDYWLVANIDRRLDQAVPPTLIRQDSYRPAQNQSHNVRFGADYTLGKRSTVGVLLNGLYGRGKSQGGTETKIYAANQLTASEPTTNDNHRTTDRLAANLTFRHQFDSTRRGGEGQELLVDMDYSDASFIPNDQFMTRYFDAQGREAELRYFQQLNSTAKSIIRAAKADYIYPFDKRTTFEVGWKSSFVSLSNDLRVNTGRAGSEQAIPWRVDSSRSNQFAYQENIHAAYLTGRRMWGPWTLQLGVRAEMTQTEAYSVTANTRVERSYLNVFPSIFLTRTLGEKHKFQYSFSQRIDRPIYNALNPFIRVINPYAYQQGNPYLKPQYTDAFQVGYSYKEETTISFGYNRTRDVIADINVQDDATGVTQITYANLAQLTNMSLNLSAPFRFNRWWSSRQAASIFHNRYQAEIGGTAFELGQLSTTLSSTHSFVLPYGLTAEAVASYNSPYVFSQNRIRAFGQLSIGLQKNLWKKRAVLRFNWSDLLQTQRFWGTLRFQNMDFRYATYGETRIARLTFTYNFGNRELKTNNSNRRTVSDDEQRRMGQ